jgi:hypothetical protein
MKKNALILLVSFATLFVGCSNDDSNDPDNGPLESFNFALMPVDNSGVEGMVTVSEKEDGTSTVTIELNGSTTEEHPAFIYHGNVSQDSEIAITLNACTCDKSVTQISQLDNGAKISYDGLKAFNGHVKIHLSPNDLDAVVAAANIGVNAN